MMRAFVSTLDRVCTVVAGVWEMVLFAAAAVGMLLLVAHVVR
ncbi:MAG: hypothetical protein ACOC8F_02990 [Planctomycetota bacterium]